MNHLAELSVTNWLYICGGLILLGVLLMFAILDLLTWMTDGTRE